MGLVYSDVDTRNLALGIRNAGKWYNFLTQGWETPFDSAKHTFTLTHDAQLPTLQEGTIPIAAIPDGSYVVEFVVSGTEYIPASTLNTPQNYNGTPPVHGSLAVKW
jgi:hypothetical protein